MALEARVPSPLPRDEHRRRRLSFKLVSRDVDNNPIDFKPCVRFRRGRVPPIPAKNIFDPVEAVLSEELGQQERSIAASSTRKFSQDDVQSDIVRGFDRTAKHGCQGFDRAQHLPGQDSDPRRQPEAASGVASPARPTAWLAFCGVFAIQGDDVPACAQGAHGGQVGAPQLDGAARTAGRSGISGQGAVGFGWSASREIDRWKKGG